MSTNTKHGEYVSLETAIEAVLKAVRIQAANADGKSQDLEHILNCASTVEDFFTNIVFSADKDCFWPSIETDDALAEKIGKALSANLHLMEQRSKTGSTKAICTARGMKSYIGLARLVSDIANSPDDYLQD